MLATNPAYRPSAKQILQHDWFKFSSLESASDNELDEENQKRNSIYISEEKKRAKFADQKTKEELRISDLNYHTVYRGSPPSAFEPKGRNFLAFDPSQDTTRTVFFSQQGKDKVVHKVTEWLAKNQYEIKVKDKDWTIGYDIC